MYRNKYFLTNWLEEIMEEKTTLTSGLTVRSGDGELDLTY